ncbi:MAG: hypothetical protein EAZ14_07155 [Runella slithyformis]|nr:MAG: hypothetical protein EAZ14_07155 [Runella slithyformis]
MKTAALVIGLWLGGGVLHTTAQRVNTDTLRTAASQIVLPQNLTLPDSLQAKITGTDTLKKKSKLGPKHSPRKAAMRSLAFPGLGQAYNKQYWKMPFVYAGLGASVFFLIQNHNRYCDFLEPFLNSYDLTTGLVKKEITPTTLIDVYVASQGQTRGLTLDQITRAKDTYRRWRDLNIIIIAGVWALNAVEANVSAHLLTFDMSDDISLRVSPDLQFSPLSPMPVWGVSAVFSIK